MKIYFVVGIYFILSPRGRPEKVIKLLFLINYQLKRGLTSVNQPSGHDYIKYIYNKKNKSKEYALNSLIFYRYRYINIIYFRYLGIVVSTSTNLEFIFW